MLQRSLQGSEGKAGRVDIPACLLLMWQHTDNLRPLKTIAHSTLNCLWPQPLDHYTLALHTLITLKRRQLPYWPRSAGALRPLQHFQASNLSLRLTCSSSTSRDGRCGGRTSSSGGGGGSSGACGGCGGGSSGGGSCSMTYSLLACWKIWTLQYKCWTVPQPKTVQIGKLQQRQHLLCVLSRL